MSCVTLWALRGLNVVAFSWIGACVLASIGRGHYAIAVQAGALLLVFAASLWAIERLARLAGIKGAIEPAAPRARLAPAA
jgi:hypothetical protein